MERIRSLRPVGRLHVLTDTQVQQRYSHLDLAALAIAGGAEAIQFREKRASTRELIATARQIADLCRRAGIPLIVNDRIDVALAADAQGVHLGVDDFPISLARQLLGPDRVIGASARTPAEARAASRAGADYLGVGPLFATTTKADAGAALGAAGLREVVESVEIPVIAIGGISADRLPAVHEAGAYGVAVISAVVAAEDPQVATRALRAACDRLFAEQERCG